MKVARSENEAVVNCAMCELKAALCGQNCSTAVAQECVSVKCKEPSCTAKFLAKGIGEIQKGSPKKPTTDAVSAKASVKREPSKNVKEGSN